MADCRIIQTSRGPVRLRVPAQMSDAQATALAESLAGTVAAIKDRQCGHVGPHVMPEIAQKMHGQRTYECGLDKGHEGPHEWSGRTWTEVEP